MSNNIEPPRISIYQFEASPEQVPNPALLMYLETHSFPPDETVAGLFPPALLGEVVPHPTRGLPPPPPRGVFPPAPHAVSHHQLRGRRRYLEPPREASPEPAPGVSQPPAEAVTPPPAESVSPPPARGVSPDSARGVSPGPAQGVSPPPAEAVTPPPAESVFPPPARGVSPDPPRGVALESPRGVSPGKARSVSPDLARGVSPQPARVVSSPPVFDVGNPTDARQAQIGVDLELAQKEAEPRITHSHLDDLISLQSDSRSDLGISEAEPRQINITTEKEVGTNSKVLEFFMEPMTPQRQSHPTAPPLSQIPLSSPLHLEKTKRVEVARPENKESRLKKNIIAPPFFRRQNPKSVTHLHKQTWLETHNSPNYISTHPYCTLNLVCYRTGTHGCELRQLQTALESRFESHESFKKAISDNPEFISTDSAFFLALRDVYLRRMCGVWRRYFFLTTLRGIRLLSFTPTRRPTVVPLDEFVLQEVLFAYQNPSKITTEHEWIDWVFQLRQPDRRHALEFVEGWNGTRIAVAGSIPLAVSIVVGIVWSVRGSGIQDGFAIAGFILTAGSLLLALLAVISGIESSGSSNRLHE